MGLPDLDTILNDVVVVATTIDDVWFQCLDAVVNHGYVYFIDRGSYEGQHRLQLGNLNLRIRFPWMEPRLPIMPEGSNIPPPADQEYLDDYLPYLLTAAIKTNEQYTYGQLINGWEYWKKNETGLLVLKIVNQYKIVTEMIANDPGTNQAVISVCEPQSILLKDPPCLRQIQVQIVGEYLCFTTFWRSWDLWGGLPGNLAAIQAMKELMLLDINKIRQQNGKEEFKDGQLIAKCVGAHIYDHNLKVAEMRLMLPEGNIEEKHKDEMRK